MGQITRLRRNAKDAFTLSSFLQENEHLLPDPLSKHIDIPDYALKLISLGETFAYTDKDIVCGIVTGYINDFSRKEAYLQVLLVSDNYQGNHISTKLIDCFIHEASNQFGSGKVFLNVDKSNSKAYDIYIHLGFVPSQRKHKNPNKLILEFCL